MSASARIGIVMSDRSPNQSRFVWHLVEAGCFAWFTITFLGACAGAISWLILPVPLIFGYWARCRWARPLD